jgi:hypothetical protein
MDPWWRRERFIFVIGDVGVIRCMIQCYGDGSSRGIVRVNRVQNSISPSMHTRWHPSAGPGSVVAIVVLVLAGILNSTASAIYSMDAPLEGGVGARLPLFLVCETIEAMSGWRFFVAGRHV